MTEPKPCTVKGCKATSVHHHNTVGPEFVYCGGIMDKCRSPRLSREQLAARLAAVEAENADLHAEIADKKDRIARLEKPASAPFQFIVNIPRGVDAFRLGQEFGKVLAAHAPGSRLRFAGGAL